jgi:2-methylcitrate dehydratase PrpD
MPEETLSEKLARHHVALQLSQVPAAVTEAAKLHILDSLGCLFAGSRLAPGKLAYDFAVAKSGNSGPHAGATLFGTGARVSYLDAVEAMSVAAHCGEMDDIHSGAGTCIGGMVIPALIAMAEKFGGTGPGFLEGVIVGYETTTRIGLAINAPSLFARGWWPSTLCGVFGTAAAGAKFLGWPVEKTVTALGIASLHTGGMITGGHEGATARHLVFGRSAQSGVVSLLAAEQGFTGPKRPFEDSRGFCLTLCAEPKWEYLESREKYFLPEVAFKPYACARQLHAGVEAFLHLIRQHAISAEGIEEIELSLPTPVASLFDRPGIPANRAAALGSAQYVMAVTVIRSKMDLDSFQDEFLQNHQVQLLSGKVKVKAEAPLDAYFPKTWPGAIHIRLSDGKWLSHEVIIPKGESGNPMSREDLEEKFLSLAAPVLGDAKARDVMREVQSLDARDSLAGLLSTLAVNS